MLLAAQGFGKEARRPAREPGQAIGARLGYTGAPRKPAGLADDDPSASGGRDP